MVPRSVSFTKGCFTGQELVARIDSRGGNVPRRLRLVVADTAISAGETLVVDGAEVGLLTSVANDSSTNSHIGLAYVKRVVDPSESPVAGSVTDREVQIKSLVTG